MSEDGTKAAAAPKFEYQELLNGYRLAVQDLQKYYALRAEQKHADYPEADCKHRFQCAVATGLLLKHIQPILSMVKPTTPDENK